MESSVSHSKSYKISVILGSLLLVLLAVFHGSGLKFVNDILMESNAENFIKEIFPVLFIHPSIHLLGLAAFGLSTLSMKSGQQTVLRIITSLILISAFAAFYLTAIAPGIILLVSASSFLLASYQK